MDIFSCWECQKKLTKYDKDFPFHCSIGCRNKCGIWNYKLKGEEKEVEIINGQEVDLEEFEELISSYEKKKAAPVMKPEKKQYICGHCGELGHNKRTCKKK